MLENLPLFRFNFLKYEKPYYYISFHATKNMCSRFFRGKVPKSTLFNTCRNMYLLMFFSRKMDDPQEANDSKQIKLISQVISFPFYLLLWPFASFSLVLLLCYRSVNYCSFFFSHYEIKMLLLIFSLREWEKTIKNGVFIMEKIFVQKRFYNRETNSATFVCTTANVYLCNSNN